MADRSIWTTEFLQEMRQYTDPLADQVVEQIVTEKGPAEARRIFDLLIRRIEIPLEELPLQVQDYLDQTNQLPEWVDWAQVDQAHDFFLDHGPKLLMFLYYKSLPLLYCCKNGAEVLVRTSRLTNEQASWEIFTRRIAETGQFLVDVMTRNGLKPGGIGIQTIQKVRLIHAAIRIFVGRGDWDEATLGRPINQEDMAVTLMTFSVAMVEAVEYFRIEVVPGQLEAYVHTWNGIGSLLGLKAELLPDNVTEARVLLERILQHQAATSESGVILAEALVKFAEQVLPGTLLDSSPAVLIRELIGGERADMLKVYPKSGCLGYLAPTFLQTFFRWGEKFEDKVDEPIQLVLNKLSQKTVSLLIGYFDQYKQRHFTLPSEFREAWDVG